MKGSEEIKNVKRQNDTVSRQKVINANEQIGEKFVKLRKDASLTQVKLGDALNEIYCKNDVNRYSQTKIKNMEYGRTIEPYDIAVYADYFHRSADYFLYGMEDVSKEDQPNENPNSLIGLSESAISNIRSMNEWQKDVLNKFLESVSLTGLFDLISLNEEKINHFVSNLESRKQTIIDRRNSTSFLIKNYDQFIEQEINDLKDESQVIQEFKNDYNEALDVLKNKDFKKFFFENGLHPFKTLSNLDSLKSKRAQIEAMDKKITLKLDRLEKDYDAYITIENYVYCVKALESLHILADITMKNFIDSIIPKDKLDEFRNYISDEQYEFFEKMYYEEFNSQKAFGSSKKSIEK